MSAATAACSARGDGLGVTGWWVVCAVTAVKVSPGPASVLQTPGSWPLHTGPD